MTRLEVYEEVLARLDEVERDGNSATGSCPICGEPLTIRLGRVSPVVYCQGSGCSQEDVFDAIGVTDMVAALTHPKADLREFLTALAELGVSDDLTRLAVALWAFTDDEGRCFPSDRTLAPLVNRVPRSVPRSRRRLEALGVIRTTRQSGKRNVYGIQPRALWVRGGESPGPRAAECESREVRVENESPPRAESTVTPRTEHGDPAQLVPEPRVAAARHKDWERTLRTEVTTALSAESTGLVPAYERLPAIKALLPPMRKS